MITRISFWQPRLGLRFRQGYGLGCKMLGTFDLRRLDFELLGFRFVVFGFPGERPSTCNLAQPTVR